ncbi:MAG: TolC family protein [Myxococcota bacterium]|jgi:outer membrane protein TolC|nr:TolC family protein [Myxococcota bacterium]
MTLGLLVPLLVTVTPITLEEVLQESAGATPAVLARLDGELAGRSADLARTSRRPRLVAGLEVGGAWAGAQTVLGFGGDDGHQELEPVDAAGRLRGSYDVSLRASQLLFGGGRVRNEIARADQEAAAAASLAAEERLAARYEGTRRFYELLRAQQQLAVLEAVEQRSAEQLALARSLFTAGRGSALEALAAESNLAADRRVVLQQRARLVAAAVELAAFLGRDPDGTLQAVAPPELSQPSLPLPTAAQALAQARQERPLWRARQQQIAAARLGEELARATLLPEVVASVGYSRPGSSLDPVFLDPTRQHNLAAGITLTWELYSGGSSALEEQQAALVRQRRELELVESQREEEAALRAQLATLEQTRAEVAVADGAREVAQRTLQLAQERFRAGAGSTLEVRDAQLKLAQGELGALETRIDVALARARFVRLLGGEPAAGPAPGSEG